MYVCMVCVGLSLGPLLSVAIAVDPSLVPTAFLGTAVVFGCLSFCALRTTDRGYLYLGGCPSFFSLAHLSCPLLPTF